jgi:hypothetical protein
MKRTIGVAVGLAVGIVASLALLAVAGWTATQPQPYGPPIGPDMAADSGAGEMLVVVLGGEYATRAEAEDANDGMPFGDLAGYYVVPVAQFQGFRQQLVAPGDFALVSVFRTERGAQEFADFARLLGYPAAILPDRVRSLGGVYAGLGQESDQAGDGPLLHPVPPSLP